MNQVARRGFLDPDPDRFVRIDENTYRTIANELRCYVLRLRERELLVQEVPARRRQRLILWLRYVHEYERERSFDLDCLSSV